MAEEEKKGPEIQVVKAGVFSKKDYDFTGIKVEKLPLWNGRGTLPVLVATIDGVAVYRSPTTGTFYRKK